jgi:hypothetical protein
MEKKWKRLMAREEKDRKETNREEKELIYKR